MQIQVISFYSDKNEKFSDAMKIRFKVFVDEIGIDKDLDYDGLDFDATHFLLLVDEKPAATVRFREIDEGIVIERLSVLPEYRHLALGMFLLKYVIQDVLPSKRKIFLYSPDNLQGYFEFAGFKPTDETLKFGNDVYKKMILKIK